MAESSIYKDGGTITTMNINKQNAEKAKILDSMQNKADFDLAAEKGRAAAYDDVRRILSSADNRNNYIVEGSPEDLAMQANINRGINYQPEGPRPGDTSVIDSVRSRLASIVNGVADWYNNEPEKAPAQEQELTSRFYTEQEADYNENESVRAAQSEIDRILSNKQY